ncbi:alpha/beta fold hydrolase [Bowmanella dokdonensis]|uniref:Alpha/beta fold hydrolase n=1 Tax=Bowmanella dokdonensis TaxID=751969 RepID=A0A939DQK6_9ALTE|nr:alpha/beta fold hydrolase [Bowmanella dokdonensis]MBN7826091.1 alpha/beta fold hydrolase [Bowmanella dokdonensis]
MSSQLPVIFFPGTQCDERLWLPVWRQMQLADRRYVPLQWAETLEQMLGLTDHAAAGDKAHLVGFSMGGYIASRFALDNPQQVASLTLIGFCSTGLTVEEVKQRKQIIRALEKGQFRPMSAERLAMLVNPDSPNRQLAEQTVREMEQDLGAAVLKYHLCAASERPNLTGVLAGAPFVINILAAAEDRVAPLARLQAMQQEIGPRGFEIFAGAGHMLPLEQPQALAASLTRLLQEP